MALPLHKKVCCGITPCLVCRAVVQDFLNLKLFLTFHHDDRRSLHTITIVVGVAQHTDMEGRMDLIVSRYFQCVVDWTSLGKDLERSQPSWQQLA